jgi:methyltransferase (TIGR00027 family)
VPEQAEASRTAAYMALFRALETGRRGGLFADPYAVRFLPGGLRAAGAAARVPPLRAGVCRYIDRRWPGARTSAVARTRAIDDLLAEALGTGLRQVVFLGAGYDTRALRLPSLAGVAVFELDQPALLAAKRERLGADAERTGPATARALRRVPIDFARDEVVPTLARAGFDPASPAVFVWEGVTNYLTAEAADSTFRAVASTARGGRLAFTYVHSGVIDGSVEFEGAERLRSTVSGVGEPWTFGLHPDELAAYLADRGLRLLGDEGADDYRRRLLGDSPHVLRGYAFYRLAVAEVAPSDA